MVTPCLWARLSNKWPWQSRCLCAYSSHMLACRDGVAWGACVHTHTHIHTHRENLCSFFFSSHGFKAQLSFDLASKALFVINPAVIYPVGLLGQHSNPLHLHQHFPWLFSPKLLKCSAWIFLGLKKKKKTTAKYINIFEHLCGEMA